MLGTGYFKEIYIGPISPVSCHVSLLRVPGLHFHKLMSKTSNSDSSSHVAVLVVKLKM